MPETDISRAFGRAIQALVEDALPGRDVYYGKVTRSDADLTFPYIVVWLIPRRRERVNLTGSVAAADNRVQLTGVGRDEDEVLTVLDRAGDAIHGRRLVIPGWRPGLVWEMPVYQVVHKNEDLWTAAGSPTYRSWSLFRLTSERGPALGAES